MLEQYRYLIDFDTEKIEKVYYDVSIIGSGIAGVYTATEIDPSYKVAIITKSEEKEGSTFHAQGGIAVALGNTDFAHLHYEDTLNAGVGLCNEKAVRQLTYNAKRNIEKLISYGVDFDKDESGRFILGREAAHTKNRIIHIKDYTGKAVGEKLVDIVKLRNNIEIFKNTFAIDLITHDGECKGILAFDGKSKKLKLFISQVVVCTSGGYSQIFKNNTNLEQITGDGIAMAYRAGAEIMNPEFVQFHPTALFHKSNKKLLITEALRGEGALLKDSNGIRFMSQYNELAELAPRDVVSKAIFFHSKKTKEQNVYLDATFLGEEYLKNRFPLIYETCLELGINISKECIPVAPSAHYCIGGIKADISGRTNIKDFYVCGETACTGVHGANRLASNSLLEGLVFGDIISSEIQKNYKPNEKKSIKDFCYMTEREKIKKDIESLKHKIKEIMTKNVGVIRNEQTLKKAKSELFEINKYIYKKQNKTEKDFETQNMLLVASIVTEASIDRKESRGVHYREDFPSINDDEWRKNTIISREGKRYEIEKD